jgi:hypothetical protein
MKNSFQVTGTKLIVGDPCYDRQTWCLGVVEDAKPGYRNSRFWGRT